MLLIFVHVVYAIQLSQIMIVCQNMSDTMYFYFRQICQTFICADPMIIFSSWKIQVHGQLCCRQPVSENCLETDLSLNLNITKNGVQRNPVCSGKCVLILPHLDSSYHILPHLVLGCYYGGVMRGFGV